MTTVPASGDAPPPRTQEDLLFLGLTAYRDACDRFRDLTGPQRRVVLLATADMIQNLRAGQVIR